MNLSVEQMNLSVGQMNLSSHLLHKVFGHMNLPFPFCIRCFGYPIPIVIL